MAMSERRYWEESYVLVSCNFTVGEAMLL